MHVSYGDSHANLDYFKTIRLIVVGKQYIETQWKAIKQEAISPNEIGK